MSEMIQLYLLQGSATAVTALGAAAQPPSSQDQGEIFAQDCTFLHRFLGSFAGALVPQCFIFRGENRPYNHQRAAQHYITASFEGHVGI